MNFNIGRLALASLAALALPGAAHAGSAGDQAAASFTVIEKCSVTGANVQLGTFVVGTTMREIGDELGRRGSFGIAGSLGTRGTEYLNWGSITCAKDTRYKLKIAGTHTGANAPGGVQFTIGTKTFVFAPYVKKIGADPVVENSWGSGGYGAYSGYAPQGFPAGVGTGEPQAVLGNLAFHAAASGGAATLDETVEQVGIYTDQLTYELTF